MGLDWYTVQLLTPLPSQKLHKMVDAGKQKDDLNLKEKVLQCFQ